MLERFKTILKNNWIYSKYFHLRYVKHRPLPGYPTLDEELTFYSKLLRSKRLIFDIGANHGDKTAAFSLISKKVVALEPDCSNFSFLSSRFYNNLKVTVVNKAISSKTGTATFFINNPGSGLNTIDQKRQDEMQFKNSYEVKTTTIDLLISEFGKPDFIKIDVEGHELEVLKGLNSSIQTIVFEANLPGAISSTIECIELINSLTTKYTFNYGYDVGLESEIWLNKKEIIEIVKKTKLNYMNIYCNLSN